MGRENISFQYKPSYKSPVWKSCKDYKSKTDGATLYQRWFVMSKRDETTCIHEECCANYQRDPITHTCMAGIWVSMK